MYDPTIGRWLSEDPIGLAVDANPNRYVGNSPTNWVDPSGLVPKLAKDIIIWILPRRWTNSVVVNSSSRPVWVGSPGMGAGWICPGEQTDPDKDAGDFVYWNGMWYKSGQWTLYVADGDGPVFWDGERYVKFNPYVNEVDGTNDPGLPLPPARNQPTCSVQDWF